MDIVIDSISERNFELQKQIFENENSKRFLMSFKHKLDDLTYKTYHELKHLHNIESKIHLILTSIQLIKNECDMIPSNMNLYITKLGTDIYIRATEYADGIIKTFENEIELLNHEQQNNNTATYIGTFSFGNKDISLPIHDHKEMNQVVVLHDIDESKNDSKVSYDDVILKMYYKKKYVDSKKTKKVDSKKTKKVDSIYDTKHYNNWYESASKKPSLKLENELDLYKYYQGRFADKYKLKKNQTIFDSSHFENWIAKKKEHLNNVKTHLKKKSPTKTEKK